MTPLFGYGTFRRPAWRRAIFGVDYPARDARLHGWRRAALASGYLTLIRDEQAAAPAPGVLLDLDDAGWEIADAWEEVPRYQRLTVRVESSRGQVDAVAYIAPSDGAARSLADDRLAAIEDTAVEAAIARFIAAGRRP